MANLDKIREALSFGARTGDPELMAAVYQLEAEGQEIEVDNGPKFIQRKCSRCSANFYVSERHANAIPPESLFNLCECCLGQIASEPEDAPLSPADDAIIEGMIDEILGDMFE